ncbi:MAG: RagB/SusD family nutrient uptake outer membrane protein [Bacteroidota bacterium]
MKKYINIKTGLFAVMVLTLASCAKKLDLFPINDFTSENAYATAAGYKGVLSKVYGGLSVTGLGGDDDTRNIGAAGNPDIVGLNEGYQTPFLRQLFNFEELPTDEAIEAWNDQGVLNDFHNLNWTPSNTFNEGLYARLVYNVTIANEYIREAADDKVAGRGITGADAEDIKKSRAEARFLRALNYWALIDLYGKSTFITEADGVGAFLPKEISRTDLFTYVEKDLKEIEDLVYPARTAPYGRADQGAVWSLLARLYLNAKVYTGVEKNTEAITYAKKVIDAGYTLHGKYAELFMADNDKCTDEIIFPIVCDGAKVRSFGNTTFFIHAPCGDDYAEYGSAEGWYGYRATSALGDLFPKKDDMLDSSLDKRAAHFFTSVFKPTETQMEIATNAPGNFGNGLHIKKYVNVRTDGLPVADAARNGLIADIDFPMFRLAEIYFIYAEAVLRGGAGGNSGEALDYLNNIRRRAYGGTYGPSDIGKIKSTDLNLQFILDERARELYWEAHRRTDLVRYNLLTTSTYLWPWKGGVADGTAVESKYNIYPIPSANLSANKNLTQNDGYTN